MIINKFFVVALFSIFALFLQSQSHAGLVISVGTFSSGAGSTNGNPFGSGGDFDDHVNGSTVNFSGGGSTVVLTTQTVSPSGDLGVNSAGLGVNATGSGDEASGFDVGESWSFSFDTAGMLTDLDFGVLTDSGDEFFTISSASLGTLTFENNGAADQFAGTDSADNVFGNINIAANEIITLSYFSPENADGNSRLEGFQFAAITTAVPEPTSATLFGMASMGLCMIQGLRRRRRR